MKSRHAIILGLAIAVSFGQASPSLVADPPSICSDCAAWNAPREPFRIYGNTYYVGVAGLSAVLITTDVGLILIDGGLSQSAPLVDTSIRALGFRTEDIRLIVNSHAHYDHAGAIAALQRVSNARVAASALGAKALEQGGPTPDDPQYGFGRTANAFPAAKAVKVVADGETLRLGATAITVHYTPGHTPGGTTWSWRSCEGERCLDMVYADSLTAVAAPGFRFTGDGTHPGVAETLRHSIAVVGALPCDVLIAAHPFYMDLDEKIAMRKARPDTNPFIDPGACRAYAADAATRLDARIAAESSTPKPPHEP